MKRIIIYSLILLSFITYAYAGWFYNPTTDELDYYEGGKATTALDNLASVAINTSLISDTDSTDDLGSSSIYWANTYTDKLYLNSTASLDGATAGRILLTGNLGLGATPTIPLLLSRGIGVLQRWQYNANPAAFRLNFKSNEGGPVVWYSFDLVNNSTTYTNNLVLDRGNVGIGVATPTQELDVVGNIQAGGIAAPAYYWNPTVGTTWHSDVGAENYLRITDYDNAIEGLVLKSNTTDSVVASFPTGGLGVNTGIAGGPATGLRVIGPTSLEGTANITGDTTLRGNLVVSDSATLPTISGSTSIGTITTSNNIQSEPKQWMFNVFDPLAIQTLDTQVLIDPKTSAALTVTRIIVSLDASGNEIQGDLKYADTFIGLANAVVINTFDTTLGVLDDSSITVGAVPAGKTVYLQFDVAPHTDITQGGFKIKWDYD